MGSLPNLNELGKSGSRSVHCFRTGLPIEYCHLYGAGHSTFLQNDNIVKSRMVHRNSAQDRLPRVRSNGHGSKNMYDDLTLEHMAAYSPISSRSIRNLSTSIKRRDSLNSSIGATSVRRLIGVVRNAHGRCGPIYSRRTLIRNLIILCVLHILITVTFLPFLALQGSVSMWTIPFNDNLTSTVNVGPLLLMGMFLISAIMVLLAPAILHYVGTKPTFIVAYCAFCVFYTVHIYPVLYALVPAYILLGLVFGPLHLCHVSFLLTLSTKISYTLAEEEEDSKSSKKAVVTRRVARAFQAAQDFGLIFGSLLAAAFVILTATGPKPSIAVTSSNATTSSSTTSTSTATTTVTLTNPVCELRLESFECIRCNVTYSSGRLDDCIACYCSYCENFSQSLENLTSPEQCSSSSSPRMTTESNPEDYYEIDDIYNTIFEVDEIGERICGSAACPYNLDLNINVTDSRGFSVVPRSTILMLTCVFTSLSAFALLVSAVGLDKIKAYVLQDHLEHLEVLSALESVADSFKDAKLQLAAPLAFFIGLEQAFMYSDFSKYYVICTIGIQRVNVVFLSMGLLQSIAACTLSMLLRTIKRYYVVAVGFTFHACLLMVLMLWKPISDDPALFYVISAAWGVCNAIWEMLNFTLLTGLYSDNWEAPFANSAFFKFLGLALAFGAHGTLCNWIKLYILAIVMFVAIVLFGWLEFRLESIRKTKNVNRL